MASNIETKINRIAAAKEAISAAIAGKGVTVPDGTLIDGMAELIASIETGGGVELQYNRLYPAATGTFTPAERTAFEESSPLVIEHNSGIVPFVIMVTSNGMNQVNDLDFIVSWRIPHFSASYYDISMLYSVSSRRGSRSTDLSISKGAINNSQFPAWDITNGYVAQLNSMIYVNSGKTYTWTVYGIE